MEICLRFDTDGHEDLKFMRGGEGDLEEEEFNPLVEAPPFHKHNQGSILACSTHGEGFW